MFTIRVHVIIASVFTIKVHVTQLSSHNLESHASTNKSPKSGIASTANATEAAFKRQFQDVMEEERAKNTLKRGIRMQGDNIDEYISRFEMLTRQAGYV